MLFLADYYEFDLDFESDLNSFDRFVLFDKMVVLFGAEAGAGVSVETVFAVLVVAVPGKSYWKRSKHEEIGRCHSDTANFSNN